MSMPLPVKVSSKLIKELIDSKRDYLVTDGSALTTTSINDDIVIRNTRNDFDGAVAPVENNSFGNGGGLFKRPATTGASQDLKASLQQKAEQLASRFGVESNQIMVNEFKGLVSLVVDKPRMSQLSLGSAMGFVGAESYPIHPSSTHRSDATFESASLVKRPPEPRTLFIGEQNTEVIVPFKNIQRAMTLPTSHADGLLIPRAVHSGPSKMPNISQIPTHNSQPAPQDNHLIVVSTADRSRLSGTNINTVPFSTEGQSGFGSHKIVLPGSILEPEGISIPIPSNQGSRATTIFVPSFKKV